MNTKLYNANLGNMLINTFDKKKWLLSLLMSIVLCQGLNAQNTSGMNYFNLVLPDNSMVSYELTDGIDIHFQDSIIIVNGLNYYMENMVKYYFSADLYYSLIVTANPTEGGIVSGGGNFLSEEICTVTAVPNEGFNFWCWVEDGKAVSTETNYSFTLSGPRNLVALFRPVSPNPNIIVFVDPNVEMVCLENWDTDGDGYLSYDEATTVTSLGYVFEGNTSITSFDELQYFTGLTSIGSYAFYNCSGLASFVLPSSVTTIGEEAFYYCTSLNSVTIGENVTDIGHYAFASCSNLTTLNYNAINSNASNAYMDYGWLEYCPNLHTLNIGENVQVIPDNAFNSFNVNFTGELVIPASVTSIGKNAFANNNFTMIYSISAIPPTLGDNAFENMSGAQVYVPCDAVEDYESISWGGFNNITGLCDGSTVTVEADPTEGGTVTGGGYYDGGAMCTVTATANEGYTFVYWTKNGKVTSRDDEYTFIVAGDISVVAHFVPDGNIVFADDNVKNICVYYWDADGDGELSYYEAAAVTTLSSNCFGYNTDITSFDELQYFVGLTEIKAYAFNHCENLTSVIIPNSVLTIGNYAFRSCSNLSSVTIGSSVEVIGEAVFYTCENLSTIICYAQIPPTVNVDNWYLFNSDIPVYVPCGTADVYQNTSLWNYFTNYIEMNCSETITQSGTLVAGWNWYSTYIEQSGIDGLTMLEESLGDAGVRIQGRNQYTEQFEYQGEKYWYGTLTSITNEQMYKVRTNVACDAAMTGLPANPANHPITINSGWNWIGLPTGQSVSVASALGGFTPEADDVLKGRNGSTTYIANYGWYGTLNTLEPGKGYMYKSNSNTAKTLTFQTGSKGDEMANINPEDNIFIPEISEFSDNMTVTAVVDLNGIELRSEDYELAAFVGGECRGSVKLMYVEPIDRYVAFLLVFGDEAENISFALTDGAETIWSGESMVYSSDALIGTASSPATIHFGVLSMDDNMMTSAGVYPNPVSRDAEISISIPQNETIKEVVVTDIVGNVIRRDVPTGATVKGMPNTGVYMLQVICESGNIYKNKVVVK